MGYRRISTRQTQQNRRADSRFSQKKVLRRSNNKSPISLKKVAENIDKSFISHNPEIIFHTQKQSKKYKRTQNKTSINESEATDKILDPQFFPLATIKRQGYQRKKSTSQLHRHIKGALEPAAKYRPPLHSHRRLEKITTSRRDVWTSRRLAIASTVAVFMSIALVAVSWWTYDLVFLDLPTVTDLTQRPLAISSKIYDRNGELLYTMYDDENRTLVPLSKMSPNVIQATVAIEDRDFFEHHGFSLKGISRAVIENFQGKPIQGGSTITQQLVKNRLLSSEKSYKRKLRELLLALLVERSFTKEQILEMYLNTVAFGGSTYGIEEAAQRYFGKSAQDLNLAESALLAGLPAAPSAYSPFGPNPEYAKARQLEVLRRMEEDAFISPEQMQVAMNEPLALINDETEIKAPHFVMYIRQILADKYGEDALYTQGLKVTTSLDLGVQEKAQQIVTDEINTLKRLRITNGAALVTNPTTGEILAMVGSINYFDLENDGQVNVTLRPRQPGSSIKPLTYSMALESGMTMSSPIIDSPVSYSFPGSPPYAPKNYDGKFHGTVTLKTALANSYNIPAVKMLANVGINNFIDRAQKMGISTWDDRSRFGLSLALGSGEVKMIDLATVYGVFANKGYRVDPNPILEITNAKGEVVYRNECAKDSLKCSKSLILDEKIAYVVSNILSDNKARTPAFGALSTLFIPNQEVAVKTGTTNSMRDNWTIGYTSDRLVAVWVGNNDNQPMSYVASGITGASPIWNKIMRTQLSDEQPHLFELPAGMVKTAGCNGLSSGDVYIAGTEPKGGCPKPPAIAQPGATPQPGGGPSAARENQRL